MKKKMCNCKACGAEIRTGAKFCQYCGAKVEKPLYKKWWFWLIIVAVIGFVSNSGDSNKPETESVTPPTVNIPSSEVTEATEATFDTIDPQATEAENEPIDYVLVALDVFLANSYDYHEIEGDETEITINVASDGLAEAVTLAKIEGCDETYQPWVDAKKSMISACNSTGEFVKESGFENTTIFFNLLNDQNHDNVLLMIMNGAVVYDVMAE